jgi:hypothetical protein
MKALEDYSTKELRQLLENLRDPMSYGIVDCDPLRAAELLQQIEETLAKPQVKKAA